MIGALDLFNITDGVFEKKYKEGGNVNLLAPNGKTSKLTPEQYKLVRTPEFKHWFGDWENNPADASKVVDENGEPLVVYHGTFIDKESGEWNEFSLEGTRSFDVGFHFGTRAAAQERIDDITRNETDEAYSFMSRGRDVSKPRMLAVFLNIKNPIRLQEHDRMPSWKGREILNKIFDGIEGGLFDNNIIEAFGDDIEKHYEDELKVRYDEYGEGYLSENAEEYPDYANPERQNRWIEAYLRSKGFYGIVYNNTVEDKGNDSFIVFSPSQIKLADGSNTTFDADNPDIRLEGGGKVEYKNEKQKIINSIDYLALQEFIKNDLDNSIDLDVIKKETRKFIDKIFSFKNSDNTIFIYRNMYVDSDYLNKLLNGEEVKLGHYWSYDKDKAESWDVADTLNKKSIIICAKVDFNKIDWEHTIYLYYTFGGEETESELALKNKRPNSKFTENIDVELVYVEVDDEKLYWDESERKKYKLKQGGNVLLAPNGKPSNLTPEQYKLVRTPEFKAWFGDWENDPANASKVVDSNGEPMVVYHGTYREFNVFEITREGGWFFTEFKRIAQIYAETVQMGVGSKKNEKPIIIPAFLNIRNISIKNFYQKVVQRLSPTIKSLKNKGYDGLLIKNGLDVGGYYDQYVSFKSNQIKLADGTNTTFDSNNPDIRFKNGGSVLLAPNGKPSKIFSNIKKE